MCIRDRNNAVDNTEDKPRQERQRRTPRHLRTSNNQRRRRNEVKSSMPLFAAVASPELASGKVCVDYSVVNAAKESNFLSVDELLEQEKTKKGVITPATGIVVEEQPVKTQPALDFITQPANEAVQQKVQESLERLHHKSCLLYTSTPVRSTTRHWQILSKLRVCAGVN